MHIWHGIALNIVNTVLGKLSFLGPRGPLVEPSNPRPPVPSVRNKFFQSSYIQAYMPYESSEVSSNTDGTKGSHRLPPLTPWGPVGLPLDPLGPCSRVWHLVSRLLGIVDFFSIFLRVSVSVSKILVMKKVSVSVSKIFSLEKKSRYRSRKYLVSKTLDFKNFGPGNGFIEFGLPTSPNMPNMPNNEQNVWNVHHVTKIKKMPL